MNIKDEAQYEIGRLPGYDDAPPKERVIYPPITTDELLQVLGLTIKSDEANKVITFLGLLSAYTEDSQFNIAFNAPSATGKTYIPLEIAALFPNEDVWTGGYCSPTAFFHEIGDENENGQIVVEFKGRILIFLDMPNPQVVQKLRPVLSHDTREISVKVTDKKKSEGLRTKNVVMVGFPVVVFCSAGLRFDEQEATRFFLLSPEVSQEKIRAAVYEKVRKEAHPEGYRVALESNPARAALRQRIAAIKEEDITEIMIPCHEAVRDGFLEDRKLLKPRDARDVGKVLALTKVFALLNLWDRPRDGSVISANEEDVANAFRLWEVIRKPQELNLPPYVYDMYINIILPMLKGQPFQSGIYRQEIMRKHYEVYERSLPEWQLRREILPALEQASLIIQEPDPNDRRKTIIKAPEIE
ncbi:MAG: hypothetical protein PHE65_01140 [Candidatus Omnitrophica bacterium]|nr:hypothetical protein [Candidatus Omnitrophota bacterium]